MNSEVNHQMNAVRFKLLTLIEQHGILGSRELAEHLGSTRRASAMLLLRSRRDGLLLYHQRSRQHYLSARGTARLQWLRGQS